MGKRPKMLASVIRDVIAPVLRECPAECGIVSITDIVVSDDFAHATVYISALTHIDLAMTFLEKRTKELHTKMGALHRKKIPEVRFRSDTAIQHGDRIDNLLREAEEGSDN